MKTTRKISIALVVVMILMMTLAIIPASAATAETVYLTPGPWNIDGAWFMGRFWNDSGEKWVKMTDEDGDGVFECAVPTGMSQVIFCRMNKSASTGDWGNVWNQSADLTVPSDGKNHYTVNGWNQGEGSWGTYTPPSCTNHDYDDYGICKNDGCGAGTIYTLVGTICDTWEDNQSNYLHYKDGVYSIVLNNVKASAAKYELKVKKLGTWDGAYGEGGVAGAANNYALNVDKDGSTVTITVANGKLSVEVVAPDCDHNYESTTTATCTAAGVTTYTCSLCSDSYEQDTPALGHNYDADGNCTRCDATTELITVYVKDTKGWGAVYCYTWTGDPYHAWPGEKMTYDEATELWSYRIPAEYVNVIFNKGDGNDANKTADLKVPTGETAYNNIYDTKAGAWYHVCDFSVPATCEKAVSCSLCGTESTADADKALGHTFENDICINGCGTLDPNRCMHKNTEQRDTATCTTAGYKYTYCLDCKKDITPEADREASEALGHDYDAYGACNRCDADLVYTVSGSEGLCGTNWNPDDVNNNLLFDPETGDYSITYENVKAGTYEFKVVKNHSYTGAFGENGATHEGVPNYKITVGEGSDLVISVVDGKLVVKELCYSLESEAVYYLVPGAWASDDAHFAIYWFDKNTDTNGWLEMTKVEGHSYYSATVPAGASHIVFVRIDPAAEKLDWDAKWNQSGDFAVSANGGTYLFTAFGEGEGANDDIEWHTHSYEAAVTTPTCIAGGYTIYTCPCGDSYKADETAATGVHTYVHGACSGCDEVLPTIDADKNYVFDDETSFDSDVLVIGNLRNNGDGSYQFYADTSVQFIVPAKATVTIVGHSASYGVFDIYLNGEKADLVNNGGVYTFTATEDTAVTIATGDYSHSYIRSISVATYKVIDEDTTINFTTGGNYVDSIIDFSGITVVENGNNCQVKNGSFSFNVAAGAAVKIVGYPGLSSYTISDGTNTYECTNTFTYYAVADTNLTYSVGNDGNNYLMSIEITIHENLKLNGEKAPTCTEAGWNAYYSCSCHGDLNKTSVDALDHEMITDKAVDPTCTATGLTEGSHCSRCDHKVAQTEIPAVGHEYGEWYQTVAPTEDTKGEKRRDCANCDHFETSPVAELEHSHDRHEQLTIPAVDPTCTATGLTEGKKCSDCGEITVPQQTIPALGHKEIAHDAKAATCTEKGHNAYVTCSRCVYSTFSETAALGHDMIDDAAKAPTCTEAGLTAGSHCSRCDHKVAQETVAAKGHTYTNGVCSVCGAEDPNYVAPHTHNFVNGKCECGESDPNYVPPHTHNFVNGKCECGESDPNYVAPEQPDDNKPGDEQPDDNKPGDEQPEQPEEELNFFQKIIRAIVQFFVSIGDFFKNLFTGGKK